MNKRFFEWYYMDIHQNNEYDFVFSLHPYPFMSQFKISILDAFLYFRNQLIFHKFLVIPQSEMIKQGEKGIEFKEGKIKLEITPDGVRFVVESKIFNLDLTLENEIQANLPLRFDLYGNTAEKSFEWKLFMPLARATGWFSYLEPGTKKMKKQLINGQGYFDSNNGTINLKKEIDRWQWAKIYLKDALWIAGKVFVKNGWTYNILVNCSADQIKADQKAKIDYDNNMLRIRSAFGQKELKLKKEYIVDDQRFLVSTWPQFLSFPEKVLEVFAGIAVQKKSLNWLASVLTNGRYLRKRWLAETETGEQVMIFGEEMLLK